MSFLKIIDLFSFLARQSNLLHSSLFLLTIVKSQALGKGGTVFLMILTTHSIALTTLLS